ncbi:unnamed protein product [Rotaria socialis]|uniref:L-threonine 3-dehydrogenase, mitochondrial n=2 Tax=Rotaria socialis TaxID=392032 RepID=A0A817VM21_9BILA|nr:unnamed protein product [Rotaria socialis]
MLKTIARLKYPTWPTITVARSFFNEQHPRVLITGGCGQLGIPLAKQLWQRYGVDHVILSDIVRPTDEIYQEGTYRYADVLNFSQIQELLVNERIDWIIHFSALLSMRAEHDVPSAIKLNIEGVHNILELARKYKCKLFIPSTIGAFGLESPRSPTPDICVQRPRTIYGVSKVHNELLGEYFYHKYNLDFRCLRFPAVISGDAKQEGGTTSYAIKMFHDALTSGNTTCYLRSDTRLPMMWIDDCIQSIIDIMEAPTSKLKQRTYNVAAMSFTPNELANTIRKYKSSFTVSYTIDHRQQIADSWPEALDDRNAREHWGWNPKVDLDELVRRMFEYLKAKHQAL